MVMASVRRHTKNGLPVDFANLGGGQYILTGDSVRPVGPLRMHARVTMSRQVLEAADRMDRLAAGVVRLARSLYCD